MGGGSDQVTALTENLAAPITPDAIGADPTLMLSAEPQVIFTVLGVTYTDSMLSLMFFIFQTAFLAWLSFTVAKTVDEKDLDRAD